MSDADKNWANWLAGQSWLETDYENEDSDLSTARGYFQFLDETAREAVKAGLPDPRLGTYVEQAAATRKWIEHYHPTAAVAIDQRRFMSAAHMLRNVWPSLPGGSQPQAASRYETWNQIIKGGGPRPPAE
jgi:muramidase (phage lysozyme)